ncbi:UDP-N-acetylmuramate dehydrogenase [Gammaproteobacteria bacterium]|nr:UDP-N-acetylmuramate dehydrogenase [Gammaproteobacteria bacterium]
MLISNSFGLRVKAKNFLSIDTPEDLSKLDAIKDNSILILGACTNVILNKDINQTIVQVNFKDIKMFEDYLSVGGGVDWVDFIEYCLNNNLYGIENLTHIPGSVGAAPVQNIGAYGVEVSSFIHSVECFNLLTKQQETIDRAQCKFEYRNSIFKSKNYIILKVNFIFPKTFEPDLSYPALTNYLIDNSINTKSLTPQLLSESVKNLRNSRLPDPRLEPNVGSIFKNPLVKTNDFDRHFLIGHKWEQDNGMTKLSAARLIELIKSELSIPETLRIYENHSLVLINNGEASFDDVKSLLDQIGVKIFNKFNVELEIEPEIISS